MTRRQFLPIAGVVFVALAAAIWAYVSGPTEELAYQGDHTHSRDSESTSLGDRTDSRRRQLRRTRFAWKEQLSQMADAVDAAGVRLRSNLSTTPLVQLAEAHFPIRSGGY